VPLGLRFYVGPQGRAQPVLWGTEITALFEDGRLSGSSGCNEYAATYVESGDGFVLSGLTTSLGGPVRTCATAGVMEQEAGYLSALPLTQSYRIEGDRLSLLDVRGIRVATFLARAPAEA
jgi:heat shock protein HslJ